ncbi:MAG TPA: VOC family protein [Pyrinomonadaceae bacterium]|nr:VOC family protein [Pyrinomonadaceae bacterium]
MAIQMNPYLNFNGNTEDAFNFYKSVFGGDFAVVMRFKDNPQCGEMSEDDKQRIMHVALPVSGGGVLMGTDSLESLGQKLTVGNNFSISLSPESREEADRIFGALSEGGKVEVAPTEMFWGYFGCFTDKFGVQWMLNVGNNQPV